jgi:hypothetical protein
MTQVLRWRFMSGKEKIFLLVCKYLRISPAGNQSSRFVSERKNGVVLAIGKSSSSIASGSESLRVAQVLLFTGVPAMGSQVAITCELQRPRRRRTRKTDLKGFLQK